MNLSAFQDKNSYFCGTHLYRLIVNKVTNTHGQLICPTWNNASSQCHKALSLVSLDPATAHLAGNTVNDGTKVEVNKRLTINPLALPLLLKVN